MSDYYPPEDESTRRRPDLRGRRSPVDRIPWTSTEPSADQPGETRQHEGMPPESPPPERRPPGLSVPWWGFAIVILAVAGITCALWTVVLMSRGDATISTGPTPTPIFVVITATPTLGPSGEDTPAAGEEGTPGSSGEEATGVSIPALTPTTGEAVPIQVGSIVIVVGTEGDGLSIRQGPGLEHATFFVGYDGELFIVEDGPRDVDGYVWWYIVNADDPERAGWSVEDYLEVTEP
jgi:hypothetical protein